MEGLHASLSPDKAADPDKPIYHVAPRQGWANDGNGFIFYEGRYHMFYQHIPDSSDWAWRMCWGHASSADLVNWEHEPIALRPTPGGPDEKGCWSGCCAVDQHGVPTILYTGVRMGAGPNPERPEEVAVAQPVIESQCAATADPGDKRLLKWTKVDGAIIPKAPPNLPVTGFRDPYVIQTGGDGRDWLLAVGSGISGQGGALLLYKSQQLSSGWEYVGPLCIGSQDPSAEHDTGAMWECPFFIPLPAAGTEPTDAQDNGATANGVPSSSSSGGSSVAEGSDYIMCVSPYPHVKQSPTNACLYWVGRYADNKFDLENAAGPFVLDLGDALYAPNCFRDGQGRYLMLGWFQELGARGDGFDYSGCLTLPRVLSRSGDRLHQAPAPELMSLRRKDRSWHADFISVTPDAATAVPSVHGPASNIELRLDTEASSAHAFSVLLLSENAANGEGAIGSAAVTLDLAAKRLEVVQPGEVNSSTKTFDLQDVKRRVGGHAQLEDSIHLQIFLDHSALEVFLGTGETLTTRLYRRTAPSTAGEAGIYLVAHGGDAAISCAQAFEMRSIWRAD